MLGLSSLGVDSSVGGHARLAAVPPEEYRGDEARAAGGIAALRERGIAVTVTAAARGTLSRLKRVAAAADITGLDFALSMASDGFIDEEAKTAILTERDITGHSSAASQVRTPARRRKAIDIMELKKGDYVVHEQHGIGRFVEMARRPVRPAGLSGQGISAQPLSQAQPSQLSRPLQPSRLPRRSGNTLLSNMPQASGVRRLTSSISPQTSLTLSANILVQKSRNSINWADPTGLHKSQSTQKSQGNSPGPCQTVCCTSAYPGFALALIPHGSVNLKKHSHIRKHPIS